MLADFVAANRAALIEYARKKVAGRTAPRATGVELRHGVPLFLDELAVRLRAQEAVESDAFESMATLRGSEALHAGLTIGQVVHGYGDICQAVTELATLHGVQISSPDFQKLNLCLDLAIADSVSEYARLREQAVVGQGIEHLGFLAHELRNLLNAATLAFEAVRSGTIGIGGSTGSLLGTSLVAMSELIARSLAQVRLESGSLKTERIELAPLIEEIEIAAIAQAKARAIRLTMDRGPAGAAVDGDTQVLRSILTNLMQNACKLTPPLGHVMLRVVVAGDRVVIEVEDECGGLAPGAAGRLFEPYTQHSADRSGVGLGLAISLQGARAISGDLRVRDLPGQGCVFSLELRGSPT